MDLLESAALLGMRGPVSIMNRRDVEKAGSLSTRPDHRRRLDQPMPVAGHQEAMFLLQSWPIGHVLGMRKKYRDQLQAGVK